MVMPTDGEGEGDEKEGRKERERSENEKQEEAAEITVLKKGEDEREIVICTPSLKEQSDQSRLSDSRRREPFLVWSRSTMD